MPNVVRGSCGWVDCCWPIMLSFLYLEYQELQETACTLFARAFIEADLAADISFECQLDSDRFESCGKLRLPTLTSS